MANMSYCAFENTVSDLRQCLTMIHEAREEGMSLAEFIKTRSSRQESRAVERLLSVAEELLDAVDMMSED
jgi:hypothetical protein